MRSARLRRRECAGALGHPADRDDGNRAHQGSDENGRGPRRARRLDVRPGGFSIGWCGRNGELANALLAEHLRSGDTPSLAMAVDCLDPWARRVIPDPAVTNASDTVSASAIRPFVGPWTVTDNNGAALVALAPKGAKPGGLIAEAVQVTGTVTAIDAAKRTATLQFEDGTTRTFPVRGDVDLRQRKVGDKVVFRVTEMIALRVGKP